MLTFLLVVQAIVAILLVGVILMQQSEGGGLGMGGSPTGLMSARGAADFLTRATTILATLFISLSILHAVLATRTGAGVSTIDTSLARPQAPVAPPTTTQPGAPAAGQPVEAAPMVPLANAPAPTAVPMATAKPATAKPKADVSPARAPRNASAPSPALSTSGSPSNSN
jgi:preprotein translocase subunit SecG